MSSDTPTVPTVPLEFERRPLDEMGARARAFHDELARRRSVRAFSSEPVPRAIIEDCIRAAATAPNGANRQPWHFVAISDPALKAKIREAAEEQERVFYGGRAPSEWLEALHPLGTDAFKPYLEEAPWLIAVFAESYERMGEDGRRRNYYVTESVGIATGILVTALHHAGLATLTHTPSPMGFLNEILGRPANERAFVLMVAGFPAAKARVPAIDRKPLERVATFR